MDVINVKFIQHPAAAGRSHGYTRPVLVGPLSMKTDATTQTVTTHNLVKEVLVSMVADRLRARGLPLIACPHTRGLQLENVIGGIVESHILYCTQPQPQGQPRSQEKGIPLQDVNDDDNREAQEASLVLAQMVNPSIPPKTQLHSTRSTKQKSKAKPSKRKYVKHGKYVKTESWDNKQKSFAPKKCDICNKTFRYPSFLKTHMIAHTTERPFKCEQCDYYSKNKIDLKKHVKRMHLKKSPYYCKVCGKGIQSKGRLTMHENSHLDKKDLTIKCMYCYRGFTCEYNLMNHLKIHEKSRRNKCDLCSDTFTHLHIMKQHLADKHGALKSLKSMMCLLCDLELHDWNLLLAHMKQKHKDEVVNVVRPKEKTIFNCEFCPWTYATEAGQQKHMKVHHKAQCNTRSKKCLVCNLEFGLRQTLIDHIKEKHQEYLKYPKVDTSKSNPGELIPPKVDTGKSNPGELIPPKVDTRIKSNQCDFCPWSYATESGLQRHMKINHMASCTTRSKKCLVCDLELGCRQTLIDHFKEKHQEYLKYPKEDTSKSNPGELIPPKVDTGKSNQGKSFSSTVAEKIASQIARNAKTLKEVAGNPEVDTGKSNQGELIPPKVDTGKSNQGKSFSSTSAEKITSQMSLQMARSTNALKEVDGNREVDHEVSTVHKENHPVQDSVAQQGHSKDVPKEASLKNVQNVSQSGVPKEQAPSESGDQSVTTSVKCDICSKAFIPSYLDKHLRVIHGVLNSSKSKKCLVCDREFNEWSQLIKHIKQNHKERVANVEDIRKAVVSNKCWVCDKELNEFNLFVKHMKECHKIIVQMKVANKLTGNDSKTATKMRHVEKIN